MQSLYSQLCVMIQTEAQLRRLFAWFAEPLGKWSSLSLCSSESLEVICRTHREGRVT